MLLRQIAGLEVPDAGEILVDGQKVQSPELTTRYRMAMVFQSGVPLTCQTVGENVGFYLSEHHLKSPAEIQTIVAQSLALVGLPGSEDRMPAELSGGMRMRKRVAIAEDMVRLNQRINCTTLVVSHDRNLAFGIATLIALLEDGHIIALGTPAEIKSHPDPRVQEYLIARIVPAPAIL